MDPEKSSVIAIKDKDGELVGVVYKDQATRHNLFFRCELMDFDELEAFLKNIVPTSKPS